MQLTRQELFDRLSSYFGNVEKTVVIMTNNDMTIKYVNPQGIEQPHIHAKGSSLVKPNDLCAHKAIFFDSIGFNETQVIAPILQGIDDEAWKYLHLSYTSVIEDNRLIKNEDIVFTGKVFIETNTFEIPKEKIYELINGQGIQYKSKNLTFVIRDNKYWGKIDKKDWTKVFLCHDSRDKEFVEKIHFELIKKSIHSWLDKYEMKVGDSLTEKITDGLNKADFGIIFLSKHFLSNEKWVKYELQTLMSKQIYLNQKVILPVWLDIEESDLEKHYWLKEKMGANSKDGLEKVVEQLITAIR